MLSFFILQESAAHIPDTNPRRDLSATFEEAATLARKAQLSKRVLEEQRRVLLAWELDACAQTYLASRRAQVIPLRTKSGA